MRVLDPSASAFLCAGAAVSPKHVVTACSCLKKYKNTFKVSNVVTFSVFYNLEKSFMEQSGVSFKQDSIGQNKMLFRFDACRNSLFSSEKNKFASFPVLRPKLNVAEGEWGDCIIIGYKDTKLIKTVTIPGRPQIRVSEQEFLHLLRHPQGQIPLLPQPVPDGGRAVRQRRGSNHSVQEPRVEGGPFII